MNKIVETITVKRNLIFHLNNTYEQFRNPPHIIVVEEECQIIRTQRLSSVIEPEYTGSNTHGERPDNQNIRNRNYNADAQSTARSPDCVNYCCRAFLSLIALAIIISIPVAMIYLGVVNWNACPMQPMVPIFMVVSGATFILLVLMMFCIENKTITVLFFIVVLFFFAWQITGTVYVFKEWKLLKKLVGCSTVTYEFAFGILIVFWLPFFICCCSFVQSIRIGAPNEQERNTALLL